MTLRPARLELRPGARVRWQPAGWTEYRDGKLVRPSPTNEEWLVRTAAGQDYWVFVTKLRPA